MFFLSRASKPSPDKRDKEHDMNGSRRWGVVVVGDFAVLTLGVIAVASAASSRTASPSPSATAEAGQAHTPDGDGDGTHRDGGDGRIHNGGPGDIAEALAKLRAKDVGAIMSQREVGKSYAEIAEAESVSTDELLAETRRIETAELDAAVRAGTMTAAERTQELSGLQARLEAALTETAAPHGDGGHGFGRDGDGPQGTALCIGQSASGSTQTN